jgi:hypothetical protein
VPVVAAAPPLHAIEQRIAQASLTVYQELLELTTERTPPASRQKRARLNSRFRSTGGPLLLRRDANLA